MYKIYVNGNGSMTGTKQPYIGTIIIAKKIYLYMMFISNRLN